ncbi:hypothetical protein C2G38_2180280 [Gigaspora rosea]|uniref:Uncharacterized protein n=1 Tax=Gigaspora rosea TaxID=44941 RepID=A0A397VC48_9GLOM|nr:hypothetical protein C2G38_2180280 [Gigaspora rosea]
MKIWNTKIDTSFSQLINQEQIFDINHINVALKENIESASFLAPPNIVILEAKEAPSKNENIYQAVDIDGYLVFTHDDIKVTFLIQFDLKKLLF